MLASDRRVMLAWENWSEIDWRCFIAVIGPMLADERGRMGLLRSDFAFVYGLPLDAVEAVEHGAGAEYLDTLIIMWRNLPGVTMEGVQQGMTDLQQYKRAA